MRVVGTLTTLPGRYQKLVRTLECLNKQYYPLDAIYLTIPKHCRRIGKPYPPLPPEVSSLCTIVPSEEDYGPITKIYGGLISEDDPATIIISFDDDIPYTPGVVEELMKRHFSYPHSALGFEGILLGSHYLFYSSVGNNTMNWNGFTGFPVGSDGRSVDVLCGFSSVLYQRRFFPTRERLDAELFGYALKDRNVFLNDDLLLSAHLSKHQIERRVFIGVSPIIDKKVRGSPIDVKDGNELSYDHVKFILRFIAATQRLREWGYFETLAPQTLEETIYMRVMLAILAIGILLVAIFLAFQRPRQRI